MVARTRANARPQLNADVLCPENNGGGIGSPLLCPVVNHSARGAPVYRETRLIRNLGVPDAAWAPARFDEVSADQRVRPTHPHPPGGQLFPDRLRPRHIASRVGFGGAPRDNISRILLPASEISMRYRLIEDVRDEIGRHIVWGSNFSEARARARCGTSMTPSGAWK